MSMGFGPRWLAWAALVLLAGCGGEAPSEGASAPTSAPAPAAPAIDGPEAAPDLSPAAPEPRDDPAEDEESPLESAPLQARIDKIEALLATASPAAARRALREALAGRDAAPGDPAVESLAERAALALIDWNLLALAHGGSALSSRDLPLLQRWRAEDPRVLALAGWLEIADRALQALARADALAAAGRVLAPVRDNAVALLHEVLRIDPGNAAAGRRLTAIQRDFLRAATEAAQGGDFVAADGLLAEAGKVRWDAAPVQDAAARVVELRERAALDWRQRIAAELAGGDIDAAQALLPQLDAVALDERDGLQARADIERVRRYGAYDAGRLFSDALANGGHGPGMIVLPAGRFQMGSPRGETGRHANEGPRHAVTFARGFALARTETTVAQFRAFVEATGHRSSAQRARGSSIYDERNGAMIERRGVDWRDDDAGNRAGDDAPVLHVSWDDALAYTRWLTRETGAAYRLPSEAEFEYALRAGGITAFPWGEGDPPARLENLTGGLDVSPGGRRWSNAFAGYGDGYWGVAPVARFSSNAFGLNDMNGNASEWVEDCWHDSYVRAPRDGSAWVNPGCTRRVIRGGSWASSPEQTRSAFRIQAAPGTTSARVGFRVARDL